MSRIDTLQKVKRAVKRDQERKQAELNPKCKHTPCPVGYLGWHDWAQKKAKTHKQVKCEHCELFAIWVKRGEE